MAKFARLGILLLSVLLLFWFSAHPWWVERYYSSGLYPVISTVQRRLTGWLPFSLGDLLYLCGGIWFAVGAARLLRHAFRRDWDPLLWGIALRRLVEWTLLVVIVFSLLWGLNYSRMGIAYQLGLDPKPYPTDTLQRLIDTLITRVNDSRAKALDWKAEDTRKSEIFGGADSAYGRVVRDYPFLAYRAPSVKASLFGQLDDYMGFLGYYNPFTGEAQLNNTVPRFSIFYTTCHEMAHQLGYASESEANFVGYLAAVHAPDPRFRYSAYLDLLTYANGEMYYRDSLEARRNYHRLDTLVREDLHQWVLFIRAHRNPIEPFLNRIYDTYLKAQHQPKGIGSYSQVVGWLLAFREKYGKL